MQFPILIEAGVILDLKVVLAAMAALMAGARGGAAAAAILCGYRLTVGGMGITSDIASMLTAALLGAAFFYAERRRRKPHNRTR